MLPITSVNSHFTLGQCYQPVLVLKKLSREVSESLEVTVERRPGQDGWEVLSTAPGDGYRAS
jgi:hypothetical protein